MKDENDIIDISECGYEGLWGEAGVGGGKFSGRERREKGVNNVAKEDAEDGGGETLTLEDSLRDAELLKFVGSGRDE